MQNRESVLGPLLAAAAAAIAIAYFVTRPEGNRAGATRPPAAIAAAIQTPQPQPISVAAPAAAETPNGARQVWAVSAPGRVEPKNGEIRISPQSGGRITDVLVAENDKVVAGDLLIKLDDTEIEARLAAADAEASVRRRDRDTEIVTGPARDRRTAEDAAYAAERLYSLNRAELDRWLFARKTGLATDADIVKARETVVKAREAMDQARVTLRRMLSDNLPPQTRLESALAASRADLAVADAASERLRIRAPGDGTVLQMSARVGESVAPSPENILVVLGDVSSLRVKAEVDERDVGKVRMGQAAVIRSDAFPGRDFEGRVTAIAQSLAPSKLGQKGPRRQSDSDALEVTIELVGQTSLLPGMRADVFLRPADTTSSQPQPKLN